MRIACGTQNFSIMVRDSVEAKLTLKNAELQKKINIHVEDKNLAGALAEYYENFWKKAKKITSSASS